MKKLLLILPIVLILAACKNENGVDIPRSSKDATIEPDYEYQLEVWGKNPKIYEFTPKSNPNKFCVVYNGRSELRCFDKPRKDNK